MQTLCLAAHAPVGLLTNTFVHFVKHSQMQQHPHFNIFFCHHRDLGVLPPRCVQRILAETQKEVSATLCHYTLSSFIWQSGLYFADVMLFWIFTVRWMLCCITSLNLKDCHNAVTLLYLWFIPAFLLGCQFKNCFQNHSYLIFMVVKALLWRKCFAFFKSSEFRVSLLSLKRKEN